MPNAMKLYTIPQELATDERLRELAQRALAPPDIPFDGLHIEAAMVLSQLGLVTEIRDGSLDGSEASIHCGDEASKP